MRHGTSTSFLPKTVEANTLFIWCSAFSIEARMFWERNAAPETAWEMDVWQSKSPAWFFRVVLQGTPANRPQRSKKYEQGNSVNLDLVKQSSLTFSQASGTRKVGARTSHNQAALLCAGLGKLLLPQLCLWHGAKWKCSAACVKIANENVQEAAAWLLPKNGYETSIAHRSLLYALCPIPWCWPG